MFAEAGVPVGFVTMPMGGSTTPITMAGSLVVGIAEALAAVCVVQAAFPGAPVFVCFIPSVMDLRTGDFTGGAPEDTVMGAAVADIGALLRPADPVRHQLVRRQGAGVAVGARRHDDELPLAGRRRRHAHRHRHGLGGAHLQLRGDGAGRGHRQPDPRRRRGHRPLRPGRAERRRRRAAARSARGAIRSSRTGRTGTGPPAAARPPSTARTSAWRASSRVTGRRRSTRRSTRACGASRPSVSTGGLAAALRRSSSHLSLLDTRGAGRAASPCPRLRLAEETRRPRDGPPTQGSPGKWFNGCGSLGASCRRRSAGAPRLERRTSRRWRRSRGCAGRRTARSARRAR